MSLSLRLTEAMSTSLAAVDERVIIRRRLRAKTAPQHAQTPVQDLLLGEEAPADSKLIVYLITFAYPKKALCVDGYVLVASSASTQNRDHGKGA